MKRFWLLTGLSGRDPDLAALALMGMIWVILRSQPWLGVNRLTEWVTHQFFHGLHRGVE